MLVELVYDSDCPHVAKTRENLLSALAEFGVNLQWVEWERSQPQTPEHARYFGSPAILIDGKDIGGLPANSAASCRLYSTMEGGTSGVPSMNLILEALKGGGRNRAWTNKKHLAVLPAILFALLPKLACPACWPAYAGLLSAIGIGFLASTKYLLPLTAGFLLVVLGTLLYRAKTRRGYGPFFLGLAASVLLLSGKFHFESDWVFYPGLAGLVGSSIWNARKKTQTASCCKGVSAGMQIKQERH